MIQNECTHSTNKKFTSSESERAEGENVHTANLFGCYGPAELKINQDIVQIYTTSVMGEKLHVLFHGK